MKLALLKPTTLALALGMALTGLAVAQSRPTQAQEKELAAARAEVERAAEHLAELSGKYGEPGAPIRIERRTMRKPVIGVVLASDDVAGVRIAGVTPQSAAAEAGLMSGDRLVSIDGKAISAASGVARVDQSRVLLASMKATTPVTLGYSRDGESQTVVLTPKVSDRLMFLPGVDDDAEVDRDVQVYDLRDGEAQAIDNDRNEARAVGSAARLGEVQGRQANGQAMRKIQWNAAIAPDVRREVILLDGDCHGDHCKLPVLAEAFRWNGLNLASVDDGLGRYFGTTDGVLVLSTGKDLEGLEAGDVIRKIGGKAVNSPREAMEALRAQPAAAKVSVDYLRDRKPATAQVTVPKALPFRVPPPPPMPPRPPTAPISPMMPMHHMPPAAPGRARMVEKRKVIVVDDHGKIQQWEGDADDTPPEWAAKLASDAGKVKQQRRVVIINKDGKRSDWEDDGTETPPSLTPRAPRVEERKIILVDQNGQRTVIDDNAMPPPPPPPPAPPAPRAPMAPAPPPAPPVGN